MKSKTYSTTALILTLMGTLFSGYLSATKLFTKQCAFNEPCPQFLHHPACWYGFGMFLLMLIISAVIKFKPSAIATGQNLLMAVSLLGIVFAGSLAMPEIKLMHTGAPTHYSLILPTCVYGLIFYIIIFILSVLPPKE